MLIGKQEEMKIEKKCHASGFTTSIDLDKTHRRCGILNVKEEINKILVFSS